MKSPLRTGPERRAIARRERSIADRLGVTPTGLRVLGRMVAGNGTGPTAGNAGVKLAGQGHVVAPCIANDYRATITDSGREIVRRARALGW